MQNFTLAYDATADAFTLTKPDGTTATYTVGPVVAPEDQEIDVQVSDGTTKVFVPKAA